MAPTDVDEGTDAVQTQLRWVRSGISFSGRERHCCFLNVRGQPFADISAISGLDLTDDGRAVARTDWDGDGDVDLWIANRNGPQLRFLRNDMPSGHHYLAVRLVGRTCNRDAIGARVELLLEQSPPVRLIQTVHAGDGYLAQSSKWIHFGLGTSTDIQRLIVRWPGGDVEEFTGLLADCHYRIVQGSGRAQPWQVPRASVAASRFAAPREPAQLHVLLSSPVPLPRCRYQTFDGQSAQLPITRSKPLLLILWATWCQPCLRELAEVVDRSDSLTQHLDVLALSVDGLSDTPHGSRDPRDVLVELRFPFTAGRATEELIEKLQLVHDLVFDVHAQLPIPTSVVINEHGEVAAFYQGPAPIDRVPSHVARMATPGTTWHQGSLPLPGRRWEQPVPVRLLPLVWDLIERGYLEDGLEYIARNRDYLHRDPEYAKLLALTGYQLLEHGDTERAMEQYRAALDVDPRTTVAHLNLAAAFVRQGDRRAAVAQYHDALRYSPDDPRVHYSLAWLLATDPDPEIRDGRQAERWARRAVEATAYRHLPALETLAAALAEAGRFDEAVVYGRKALELARTNGDNDGIRRAESRLSLYQNHQPYREQYDAGEIRNPK